MTARDGLRRVLDALGEHGAAVKEGGGYYAARCPAHEDSNPSLSVQHVEPKGDAGGRARVRCHAGCDERDVLAVLGLALADLYDEPIPARSRDALREFAYLSGSGQLIGVVQRHQPKTFRPLTMHDGQWRIKGSDQLKSTPYRLPAIVAAIDTGDPVWVVEGERDADTLAREGIAATCNAGGAGKWTDAHSRWLAGAQVTVCADADVPGRRHAAAVVASLTGITASVRLVEPAPGCKDITEHLASGKTLTEVVEVDLPDTTRSGTSSTGVLVRLGDVEPEAVSWLWAGRLPAGKVIVLDGDPSLGKSTLSITFAAHVSTGKEWPDQTVCPLGDVVYLSAEDGLADTLRPRLDAAGGDPCRVHALTGVRYATEDGDIRTRPPTLADVEVFEDVISSTSARLMVVDVLMAYLPTKADSHRDQDVRAVLHQIADLADRTGCTVLLLRHLNKAGGGSPMYRGGGSIGIVGAARAAYLVAPDPEDATVRVFACVKNNLAPEPPSLAYRLEPAPGSHVARVVWVGESQCAAVELLRVAENDDDRSERDEAVEWLLAYLKENKGSAPAADVVKAARSDGIAERTLKRARKRAGVISARSGFPARAVWSLGPPVGPQSGQSGQGSGAGTTGTSGGTTDEEPGEEDDLLTDNDSSCASRAMHGPTVASPTDDDQPTCSGCGQHLFLVLPGRDRCARCEIEQRRAVSLDGDREEEAS